MSKCPHCGRTVNVLRLAWEGPTKSYSCTSCKKKSRYDRDTRASIFGIGAFGAMLLNYGLSSFDFEPVRFPVVLACCAVSIVAAMHFLLKLLPVKE